MDPFDFFATSFPIPSVSWHPVHHHVHLWCETSFSYSPAVKRLVSSQEGLAQMFHLTAVRWHLLCWVLNLKKYNIQVYWNVQVIVSRFSPRTYIEYLQVGNVHVYVVEFHLVKYLLPKFRVHYNWSCHIQRWRQYAGSIPQRNQWQPQSHFVKWYLGVVHQLSKWNT